MLIIMCFVFMMMLTASLVEFAFAKLRMWQTHNAQSANFDVASFAYYSYRCGQQQADLKFSLGESATNWALRSFEDKSLQVSAPV